jgi:hypothetical protein
MYFDGVYDTGDIGFLLLFGNEAEFFHAYNFSMLAEIIFRGRKRGNARRLQRPVPIAGGGQARRFWLYDCRAKLALETSLFGICAGKRHYSIS